MIRRVLSLLLLASTATAELQNGGGAINAVTGTGNISTVTGTGNISTQFVGNSEVEFSGLLAYWPLDEASTVGAAFSQAGAHTGTYINSPTVATGKTGNCLTFVAASSQRCDVANQPVIGNISAFTICCWIKTTSTAASQRPYGEGRSSSGAPLIYLSLNENVTGDIEFGYRDDSNVGSFLSTGNISLNDGNWHWICAVLSAKNSRELFVDNVSKITGSATIGTLTLDRCSIGSMNGLSIDSYMDGSVDQLRIYNRALTSTEREILYANGR